MPMKNPPHPGEIIRDLYIEPLDLTVTQAAAGLGVSRKTLSLLLNGHAGISPEIAVRLPEVCKTTRSLANLGHLRRPIKRHMKPVQHVAPQDDFVACVIADNQHPR